MNVTNAFLDDQRQIGDVSADALVNHFFERNQQQELYSYLGWSVSIVDKQEDGTLKDFLINRRSLPEWYDEARINAGQKIFEKYAMPIMTLLGGLSLPYCYAGSPGNKALYLSDKMRKSPGKRLSDTADFILAVSTPGSFMQKVSVGQFHINKTRLIHSIARYYLLKRTDWKHEWGLPINQEDMSGTNLAFSYLILLGLQKSAWMLSGREKEDFLYLWRYIGYQLHIDIQLLPATTQEAVLLERTIRRRHFKKSIEGLELTQELIQYYRSVAPSREATLIESQMRYWLGPEVAEYLGLPIQPIKDRAVESLNAFREMTNLFQINTNSYNEMLRNHKQLKNATNSR